MKTWMRILFVLGLFGLLGAGLLPGTTAQAAQSTPSAAADVPCPAMPGYGFTLTPETGRLAVAPAMAFSYKLTLTNSSYLPRIVKLSHESMQMWMEWKHELSATKILLPACGQVDVYLVGASPGLTPPHSNLVAIRVTDGYTVKLATVKLDLVETH